MHVIGSPGTQGRNYRGLKLTAMPDGSLVMSWTQTLHDGNREFRTTLWQNGTWGPMQTHIIGSPSMRRYAITPDPAGNLHLIYLNRNIHKLLYYREESGTWHGPEEIGESTHYYEHLSLHLGTDSRLHAAFGKGTSIEAFSRVNGVWSPPETLVTYTSAFALNGLRLLTDERGNRHLIRMGVENQSRGVLYHAIYPPASGQPNPTPTPPPQAGGILLH